MEMPKSPFTTQLSGSAKETELRLRNIFQWKKKRPPVIALVAAVLVIVFCGALIGFDNNPRNGTLGEIYQEYFAENPISYISYENKEDWGYPSLTPESKNFGVAAEYVQSMELHSVLGQKQYIGDFNRRNGAVVLRSANGQELWIDLYRTGYVVVSDQGAGRLDKGDDARVYEVSEAFDVETFLSYLAAEFPEEEPREEITDEPVQEETDSGEQLDPGLTGEVELITSDGKTHPARRYDGDGWYIYIPDGWSKAAVWDRWDSQYNTGVFIEITPCTDRMEDIKAYYSELGAWPYDTDMEAPYDYYYLLNPLGGDAQNEMFFVPVSDTFSYTLNCTWVRSMQREGERELLHAMAASFTVNDEMLSDIEESIQNEPVEDPMEARERNGRLATVDGISHMPLDELPQEVLDSLTLVSETDFSGMYNPEWGWRRVYTTPGLEITTTAPSAAYLEWREEVDKNNRTMFPTEADFYAYMEGEEGREWLVNVTFTDDKYATLDGLRVGMTCAQAEALGYSLHEGQNQIGNVDVELSIVVENDTVVQMSTWWTMGRYIGKFFEL